MTWFLGISAALWLPYGLYCFANPHYLAEAAGVAAATGTGATELRAMYGGLQAGIGAFALTALLKPELRRPALLCIAFLCAGLFTSRLIGAVLDDAFTTYTYWGLGFELVSVAFAVPLLRGEAGPAST